MEHKVVKTRAERAIIAQQIQNQVQNDKLAEIRQKAKNLAEIRQKDINLAARRSKNQLENPGKTSASTKKRKARKDSLKFERLLAKKKKNLSKASDRNLPDLPLQPKSIFDQIHDPIKSGEAKKKLKPVVIVIDD